MQKYIFRLRSSFSTSSIVCKNPANIKEAPMEDTKLVVSSPEEIKQRQKLAGTITVPTRVGFRSDQLSMKVYSAFQNEIN